ncbi:phage adaptor protein [Sphingomonas desiccabilis]|uniref:Uncharacterized protein n=1 Tax=Sphingomonas desiccabilis TaxID=429134 RepID=A0A4V1QPS8_9SPHN|nr:hypothetical protein [Sphingomonas desiccabilis]MBB3910168.1 hypothetical protein [Sphingomonas desiccabilis]RXZ34847.1 hypothetical protein EO081_04085 [Sphingomonas desiccabilis]
MSFGKLKTALKGIINRKDLTDELAGDFINRAVTEMERILRVGSMEALLQATFDGTSNTITIPSAYMELIDMFTAEGTLEQVDKDRFFRECPEGRPRVFIKTGASWLLKPTPAAGVTVYVHHYAETPPLQVDTDESVWTRSGFNAALYAAAALAADYFQMEDQYVQRFQSKSDGYVVAIQNQDLGEKMSGPTRIGRPEYRGDY